MTDPLQISPDGTNSYAVTVDDHAGHVATVSIPPALGQAALSQNTGQATSALHAICAMIGAAMGRELDGISQGTRAGTNSLVAQDEQNSARLSHVGGGLGDAVKLGDITQPVGQVASGGLQAASGLFSGLLSPLGTVVSGVTQGFTGIAGQVAGSVSKNANIGGVPAVDINNDQKPGVPTGSGAVTRPASGTLSPPPSSATGGGTADRRQDQQHEATTVVPASGGPMPLASGAPLSGSNNGSTTTKVVATKRIVTEQENDDRDKIPS